LPELLTPKPQQAFDRLIDFAPLGGQNATFLGVVDEARAAPKRRSWPFARRALTSSAGPLLLWTPDHSVRLFSKGEIKRYLSGSRWVGMVAAHMLRVSMIPPHAGGLTVECKTYGIKDGRLTCSGGSMDQEEGAAPQLTEIKDLFIGIGSEGV
jgi:hypothetical protein